MFFKKTGETLCELGLGKDFLGTASQIIIFKKEIDKLDLLKMKASDLQKTLLRNNKRQARQRGSRP